MKKLKQVIDKVYDTGKLPKGLSLSDFRILENVYIALKEKRSCTFIQANILPILDHCKVKYKEQGIGWTVKAN